jgi:hypothetical protein
VESRRLLFFYLVCEAIGTAATPGLLCQPRVIVKMIVEKQLECRLAGETEVLGEKTCPSATFFHHKIPHDQTRVKTRAAAVVGSRRLTALAMARPCLYTLRNHSHVKQWLQWYDTIRIMIVFVYKS